MAKSMFYRIMVSKLCIFVLLVALLPFQIAHCSINNNSQTKCGLIPLMQSIPEINRGDNYSFDFGTLLSRVNMQKYYDTPEGHFRIHYDTTGGDAVYQPTTDTLPADGHPDFVNRCGEFFEESWALFDTLEYTMPPSDGVNGGGDGLYDAYMHHYFGTYGVAWPESPSSQYPDRPYSYTSYIYVDPSYSGFGYPDRTEPLKVTVVHEFYHAVQFSYNVWADAWFMENSSTWSEDILYDAVNDNYNYLYDFYNYPHYAHSTENGAHEYGMFVWPQYIYQNFGIDAMRNIWEGTVINAVDEVLDAYFYLNESSLWSEYRRFMVWNYFTGLQDDSLHFEEGSNYPPISIMRTHSTLPVYDQTTIKAPSGIGSNYIAFKNLEVYTDNIRFEMKGEPELNWAMDAIVFGESGIASYDSVICDQNGLGSLTIDFGSPVDSVILIVTLLSSANNQPFLYSAFVDTLTGVNDLTESLPGEFAIIGNYPNPFNAQTNIILHSPLSATAILNVYNLQGKLISSSSHFLTRGDNTIGWNGNALPSGIYYYRLACQERILIGRMALIK